MANATRLDADAHQDTDGYAHSLCGVPYQDTSPNVACMDADAHQDTDGYAHSLCGLPYTHASGDARAVANAARLDADADSYSMCGLPHQDPIPVTHTSSNKDSWCSNSDPNWHR